MTKFACFAAFFLYLSTTNAACLAEPAPEAQTVLKLPMISQLLATGKTFVYTQPDANCQTEQIIPPASKVAIFSRSQDFAYVAVLAADGQSRTGWIEQSHLMKQKSLPAQAKETDFAVKMAQAEIYLGEPISELETQFAGNSQTFPKIQSRLTINLDVDNILGKGLIF